VAHRLRQQEESVVLVVALPAVVAVAPPALPEVPGCLLVAAELAVVPAPVLLLLVLEPVWAAAAPVSGALEVVAGPLLVRPVAVQNPQA